MLKNVENKKSKIESTILCRFNVLNSAASSDEKIYTIYCIVSFEKIT